MSDSTMGLLTVPEMAQELRISRAAAYQLVKDGAIRCVRLGKRSTRVRREELERFLLDRESLEDGVGR